MFATEPPPADHPLFGTPNFICTPHLGASTEEAQEKAGISVAKSVRLALAGDIDVATARPLVEKWYGSIPRGPEVRKVDAGPVTLAAPVKREMTDQVPLVRIHRAWSGPGLNDADVQPPAVQPVCLAFVCAKHVSFLWSQG
mgnify:CR=1 FL=1